MNSILWVLAAGAFVLVFGMGLILLLWLNEKLEQHRWRFRK